MRDVRRCQSGPLEVISIRTVEVRNALLLLLVGIPSGLAAIVGGLLLAFLVAAGWPPQFSAILAVVVVGGITGVWGAVTLSKSWQSAGRFPRFCALFGVAAALLLVSAVSLLVSLGGD